MSTSILNFNGTDLVSIDNTDGQFWVTSSALARALGYEEANGVTKLYNRNKDEFTPSMTKVVDLGHTSKMGHTLSTKAFSAKTRIFSLRGCHLLAMFTRTDIAKDFRRWVLDVLDNEVARQQKERNSLMYQHNEACYHLKMATEIASSAGYNLNKYGKQVKPDLADRVLELENQMQLFLGLGYFDD